MLVIQLPFFPEIIIHFLKITVSFLGPKIHSIYFNLKNGQGGIHKSLDNTQHVDVHFTIDLQTLYKLFSGEMPLTIAVTSGKLKFEGSMEKALLFSQLFKPLNKRKA